MTVPGHNAFGQWVTDETACQTAFQALPLVAQAQVRYDMGWTTRHMMNPHA